MLTAVFYIKTVIISLQRQLFSKTDLEQITERISADIVDLKYNTWYTYS